MSRVRHSRPTPTRRNTLGSAVFALVALVLLTAGCGTSDSDAGGQPIESASAATSGECVSIAGGDNAKEVAVRTASCDGEALTFYVAGQPASGGECATANYSYVTFDDKSKVCLTPNFHQDACYQVPGGGDTTLADYKKVECTAKPAAGTAVYEVTVRADGTASCPTDQLAVNYDAPKSLGFCVFKQAQA